MPVKILVVDDEPDIEVLIRQRFRKKIRSDEFEFVFAGNGIEALDALAARQDIDIVLTDINMPEMDGLVLLGEIAKLDRMLKSVVVSAYGDLDNIRVAMNRGAFDFITKPIDFQDLEITIAKTIREVRNLREGMLARQHLVAVQQELEIAARIQRAILPKRFPPFPERPELDIHADMRPALQVGGDFYDFYFIDPARLAFVVADVAGKGVPAAILMAVTRSLLKATALTGIAPDTCVEHVNKLLCSDDLGGMFVTLFYGVLDTHTGTVSYTNAGHNPPIHLRADGVEALENQGGLVLGIEAGAAYKATTLSLAPGEGLFLYTDGVSEAMNPDKQCFGEARLAACLEASGHAPIADVTESVLKSVRTFTDGAVQNDDITLLALRYNGQRKAESL